MTNQVSANPIVLASAPLIDKGTSPRLNDLSVQVQQTARECLEEYRRLCQNYSMGASDPELMTIIAFSEKETQLLSQLSSEEKSIYRQLCATSMATERHNPHTRAVQVSQCASILQNFPVNVPNPGKGNCGLHAFADGYVAQMNQKDADILKGAIATLKNPGSDAKFVVERLDQKKGSHSALTTDVPFMTALAKVLRDIGHQGIPEYYKQEIAAMGDTDEVRSIMSNLIPEQDGQWVDHEGLICLGHILRKNVCVLRERDGDNVLVGHKLNPDIVINHKGNHFTARERRPVS